MPLTSKGRKIMRSMKEQYGSEKGESVFYASENKGSISGVHDAAGFGARMHRALDRVLDAMESRKAGHRFLRIQECRDAARDTGFKSQCPHCGSKDFALMPTDFETAKCADCGRNWQMGIVPGVNDPRAGDAFKESSHPRDQEGKFKPGDRVRRSKKWWPKEHPHNHGVVVSAENGHENNGKQTRGYRVISDPDAELALDPKADKWDREFARKGSWYTEKELEPSTKPVTAAHRKLLKQ